MNVLIALVLASGCSDTAEEDPCEGVELPTCELSECPEEYELTHGDECSEEDVSCTTGTGTGRVCEDGLWSVLEPSHGEPDQCNLECFFAEES